MLIISHEWNLPPAEAVALQEQLAAQVVRETRLGPATTVTGIDASYHGGLARAAVVTLSFPQLEVVEYATATRPVDFPYMPGLLTFREGPAVIEALEKLAETPKLLLFDGQGVAHPRRLGLASHIGLVVDMPAIGCAKSRLWGEYDEPGLERGDFTLLFDRQEIIGAVVRTRAGVRPVFVSIGHRIDLPTSMDYVLKCCRGYRLPEPLRRAHRVAGGAEPSLGWQGKLKFG